MDRKDFNNHISENLNRNLEALFNQVLEMGGLVEQQLNDLNRALETGDAMLANSVVSLDKIINREEIEIDRMCAGVLARQQPTASDLRLLIMAIRVAMDLERMGDEAVKVAKMAIGCSKNNQDVTKLPAFQDLKTLIQVSLEMLKTTLNGFSRLDTSDVMSVYHDEDRMDDVLREATAEILKALAETTDEADVNRLVKMLTAVRAAERISDHALNIAESVVYLVRGKDVRQMDADALEKLLAD